MQMTNEEIVRDFRQAAKPRDQIAILAELNLCSKREIAEILIAAGCEGVPKYYLDGTKKQKPEEPDDVPDTDDGKTGSGPPTPPAPEEEGPGKNDTLPEKTRRRMTARDLFDGLSRFCVDPDALSSVKLFTQDGKRVDAFFVTGDYNIETGQIDWFITLCTED